MRRISILGTRGIPARHGGFETFAERLALYLDERGWDVRVYCDTGTDGGPPSWRGIELRHIRTIVPKAPGTIVFDWKATLDSAREDRLNLVLGYNTAVFSLLYRLRGRVCLINMDGIEWRRAKWSLVARLWFYVNERLGYRLANYLIADHPEIARHLVRRGRVRPIAVIPYGADELTDGDRSVLEGMGLKPQAYALLIARPEPENSILEIVEAFSARPRGLRLVVLGALRPADNSYHQDVMAAASDEVIFAGAIYDRGQVASLRYFARLYIHGHQVGGTNPSLVEALGAGNPVLAHNNRFNRWVAGPEQFYFADRETCMAALDELLDSPERLCAMSAASRARHCEQFTWQASLAQYESLLARAAGLAATESPTDE